MRSDPVAQLFVILATVAALGQTGGLLPHVVVTDSAELETLEWGELRERVGTGYPSRWDDLTLVDSCLWISPEELRDHLGLSARVTAARSDGQCKYRAHLENGNSGVLLSVYVELHENQEYPREAETGFSTGVSGRQFTSVDVGADDLNVYAHKRSMYLYAFPKDGRSYWRLGYKPTYGMDDVYQPPEGSGVEQQVGPRFMTLLVKKYGERL